MNERLRDALNKAGLDTVDLAAQLDVSPKTVERWITKGRVPYPKHRSSIAALLQETENYLWPDALSDERRAGVSESEVVKVYPHRSQVPAELWRRLIDGATEQVDVLVYAGLYLAEEYGLAKKLQKGAKDGLQSRLLFGDPECEPVTERAEEEGLGSTFMGHRIRNTLTFFTACADVEGIEARIHTTTLYNSILRFDDEMLVNMHVFGLVGSQAPVMHLRQLSSGDLFETYMESFDQVWARARSFEPSIIGV
jgi:lambda repressor-like predicted transcriptional regulator